MSYTLIPNSGLFNSPELDRQRTEAAKELACLPDYKLPEQLRYYIVALETRLLDEIAQRKRSHPGEIWNQYK